MSCDIYVSYIKEPDDEFFTMKGRRDYAEENGLSIPVDVQEYFADNNVYVEGIKVQIPTKQYCTDMDYFAVKFNVVDIPNEASEIIVEYG